MAQLIKPFKKAHPVLVSQGFHAGHKAIDIWQRYGEPLVAPEDCRVVKEICDCAISDGPRGIEKGFGVVLKGLSSGYTFTYWHFWPHFPVNVGDIVKGGQIIGFMGNSGYVTQGGHFVALDKRNTPPYPGTHLHIEIETNGGVMLDPLLMFDWETEPTYSTSDLITAWLRTLKKMSINAFR